MKNSCYSNCIKRILDIFFSILALFFLSPILFIVVIIQFIIMGKNIFFVQNRVGKNERIFKLIKLRTMNNRMDLNGNLLPDSKRLTKFGRFLRITSIDELPSLINVIKGDMSLIGPRPLLVEYLPLYNTEQRKRHSVRPGLSGLAQIKGRNNLTWKEKFLYDLEYIKNISFLLDLKLLFLTVLTIFNFKIVNNKNDSAMEKFSGNE